MRYLITLTMLFMVVACAPAFASTTAKQAASEKAPVKPVNFSPCNALKPPARAKCYSGLVCVRSHRLAGSSESKCPNYSAVPKAAL